MRIIKYPHPTLRHKSKPLRRVDAALRKIIDEMLELMYEDRGIGLAANQVDLPYRLFVMNLQSDPAAKEEEHVFINPVISKRQGMAEAEEGCLSLPEIYADVKRPEKIVLSAYGLDGQELNYELSGLFARAAQHEADHLDGILFIDRLSPGGQLAVKEAVGELELEFESDLARGMIPDETAVAARLAELEALRT
ncbi:MAG TPA: peptide deformylase [Thermoguttaceae bacterium]|nr:peptide deformylase [Thermoguttaceae bacterium]